MVGDRPYPGWRPPAADLPRAIIFNAFSVDSPHEYDGGRQLRSRHRVRNDPITCDDANLCTVDSCDIGTGCVFDPIVCDPGDVCVDGICVEACDDDGTCEANEDCIYCPGDCFSGSGATCGNGLCEAGDGENCVNCADDCNGKQSGNPSGRFCCGDGGGQNPLPCSDSTCSTGGWSCTDTPAGATCCGDLICEGGEDSFNCAIDCGAPIVCGDGSCHPSEDPCSCPDDCGSPPPENCSNSIDDDCDGYWDCYDSDCVGDPACSCGARGDPCSEPFDCCSLVCKSNGTCR